MPCCAFAVFVLSQLGLFFGAIGRAVLGRRAASQSATAPPNAVVDWRLEPAAPMSGALTPSCGSNTSRRRWRWPGFALAAAVELALVLGALYGQRSHLAHSNGTELHSEHDSTVCRTARRFE
jgi:hypothetical protein